MVEMKVLISDYVVAVDCGYLVGIVCFEKTLRVLYRSAVAYSLSIYDGCPASSFTWQEQEWRRYVVSGAR
jgi:hypothetical protein